MISTINIENISLTINFRNVKSVRNLFQRTFNQLCICISAVNNVHAVILLARALNERSRRLEKEYTQEALEYLDLVLNHSG